MKELVCCQCDAAAVRWPCWIPHLSQEFTLLLLDSGLIPDCDLKHAFPEIPSVNVGVDEGLVPLGLGALLDRLSPPFTLITGTKTTTEGTLVNRVAGETPKKIIHTS